MKGRLQIFNIKVSIRERDLYIIGETAGGDGRSGCIAKHTIKQQETHCSRLFKFFYVYTLLHTAVVGNKQDEPELLVKQGNYDNRY